MGEQKPGNKLLRLFRFDPAAPVLIVPAGGYVLFPGNEVTFTSNEGEIIDCLTELIESAKREGLKELPQLFVTAYVPGQERVRDKNSFFHIGTTARLAYPIQMTEISPSARYFRFSVIGLERGEIVDFTPGAAYPFSGQVRPLLDDFTIDLRGPATNLTEAYTERVIAVAHAYQDVCDHLRVPNDNPEKFFFALDCFESAVDKYDSEVIDRAIFGSLRDGKNLGPGFMTVMQEHTAQEGVPRTIKTIGPFQSMLECKDPIRRLDMAIEFLANEVQARKEQEAREEERAARAKKARSDSKAKNRVTEGKKEKSRAELVQMLIFDATNPEKGGV